MPVHCRIRVCFIIITVCAFSVVETVRIEALDRVSTQSQNRSHICKMKEEFGETWRNN